MGKFKKLWRRCCNSGCTELFRPGVGFVRVMIVTSIILLLLFSLILHNFVIIFVLLLLVLALVGTFFG